MPELHEIPTSEELLKLVGSGNADAWTRFFNAYKGPMQAYAESRLAPGFQHLVDEVVQEVFVTLARRMSEFKYESSKGRFRDYLAKCVRSKIADLIRECKKEAAMRQKISEQSLQAASSNQKSFSDALLAEAVRHVHQSGRIEAKTWDIYRENVVDGVPSAKVADKYGIAANAVYQIKSRVSKMVREEYERLKRMRPWNE